MSSSVSMISASAPLHPLHHAAIFSQENKQNQLCPFCGEDFSTVPEDEFQSHQLICEEDHADDWMQRADGIWGRTGSYKLPFKFGAIRVVAEKGIIAHRLDIVPTSYCHECGHVHAIGHYCAGSVTCEKTERDSRREFLFRRMLG